jgi:predicted nucleic acid-binding protein
MSKVIVLDSGPLGLLMQRRGLPLADACRSWAAGHLAAGSTLLVPEIADYEVRRELLRLNKLAAINRLDLFNRASSGRYLPLTTSSMRRAAELWAQTRKKGLPTADPKELDADVIVAAQALTAGFPSHDLVIATTNPVHLARFAAAELWQNI